MKNVFYHKNCIHKTVLLLEDQGNENFVKLYEFGGDCEDGYEVRSRKKFFQEYEKIVSITDYLRKARLKRNIGCRDMIKLVEEKTEIGGIRYNHFEGGIGESLNNKELKQIAKLLKIEDDVLQYMVKYYKSKPKPDFKKLLENK
jgi:hypothetical protein